MYKKHKKVIEKLVDLQISTNNKTCGDDWVAGKTSEGRSIDWVRCIVMESIELINSYPWKHWKNINAPIDTINAKIELVDIFHFLISHSVELCGRKESIEVINSIDLDYILHGEIKKVDNVIFLVEDFYFSLMQNPSNINIVMNKFFRLCRMNNLSFIELCNLYIGKNALNDFRQLNGYKTGDYVKVWNGEEDNLYMYNYQTLKSGEVIEKHEFMEYFKEQYEKVK